MLKDLNFTISTQGPEGLVGWKVGSGGIRDIFSFLLRNLP